MADPLKNINPKGTPQSEQARSDQVANSAGGFGFAVDDFQRATRFLILGTEGGSYYATEHKLTRDNAKTIFALANDPTNGPKLVDLVLSVSEAGRAPRQNATLFTLAACAASADPITRQRAFAAISRICRTGTMLFNFVEYAEQFRGWGSGFQKAIAAWYTAPSVDNVAYQAVKYRQRDGWRHTDLLRLSHARAGTTERGSLFNWINPGYKEDQSKWVYPGHGAKLPDMVRGFEQAQNCDPKELAGIIDQFKLPWECLPDVALSRSDVWEALLPHMGPTALIRQLPRLTNVGILAPLSAGTNTVTAKLTDAEALRKGRVHPLNVLVAQRTYASGHGFQGSSTWTPNPLVIDALNDAFYIAFGALEPANKRTLLGLDVSGSMASGQVARSPLTPCEAAAAMAMVAMRTEPEVFPMAFSTDFIKLGISKNMRLDDVIDTTSGLSFGGTDCALPMTWALKEKVNVDTFIVYTDSETWAGKIHPFQALRKYRDQMGIPARLIVVGMVANDFTIADPRDAGMLDVVGFDTATPNLISSFSRGDF